MTDIKMLSGGSLAFLGDAVWSLYVREHLIEAGFNRPNDLQLKSVKIVSAKAQCRIFESLDERDYFTETEKDYFRRGRNYSSRAVPKNTDVATYKCSTGFEAIIGYLYIEGQHERIRDLFDRAREVVKL